MIILQLFVHGKETQTRKLRVEEGICLADVHKIVGTEFGLGTAALLLQYEDLDGARVTIGSENGWRTGEKPVIPRSQKSSLSSAFL